MISKKCLTCALFPLGNLEAIPKSRKALWLGRPTFTVNVENLRDTSTAWHVPKQELCLSGAHHILLGTWWFCQEQLVPPERSHWAERVWNYICNQACVKNLVCLPSGHVAISKATKSAIAFSLGALCSAALPQDVSALRVNFKIKVGGFLTAIFDVEVNSVAIFSISLDNSIPFFEWLLKDSWSF